MYVLMFATHATLATELAQMNDALRLPQDSSCNTILCAGAREVWQVCRVVVAVLNILFECVLAHCLCSHPDGAV